MSLRARLFALVSGLVALTVGLVTWTVAERARQAFENSDRLRVSAQVEQVRRDFERQGDDVVRRVERIADSEEFQHTAVAIGRHTEQGAYVNEAAPLAAAQNLDVLDIVLDDGTLVSSAEWPARFGYKSSLAGVRESSDAVIRPIDLPRDRTLALLAARRVVAGPRAVFVMGGRRLDEAFLKSLAVPAGMRAWLYRNVDPNQSLIGAGGAPDGAPSRLEAVALRARQSRATVVDVVQAGGGDEVVHAIPLAASGSPVAAVLLLTSSRSELASLVSRIRWSGVAIGALGIALGLGLSYVVADRVTRPVEELAGVADDIAAGNWTVRVPDATVAGAAGELRTLATAFDTMTRQLADQRERLVQVERVAAWRELARRLAHELKNPLFPLRLTVDNLRRARALPPSEFDEVLSESLSTLDTGLSNLNTVVGRFSDFSRMPAPEIGSINPNAIVENAVSLFRAQLEGPGRPRIAVTLDLDPGAGQIAADGEQLSRAIQNLVLNAIDAMDTGGTLAIRTRADHALFRIAVSDTGGGLTAEECTRLFTPYYTTKQHGTGLGLAIVQSVVADHHGKVWVDSAPGRGTTFHIELPIGGRAS